MQERAVIYFFSNNSSCQVISVLTRNLLVKSIFTVQVSYAYCIYWLRC